MTLKQVSGVVINKIRETRQGDKGFNLFNKN